MPATYTTWRQADQQWAERNVELFDIVFRLFMETGEWPGVDRLQRLLHQQGVRSIDVRATANSKPAMPGQLVPAFQPSIILGSRHLLNVPAARGLLELTVRATQIAVEKYLTIGLDDDSGMTVQSDDPKLTLFMPPTVDRFHPFIATDTPNAFIGGALQTRLVVAAHQSERCHSV